MTISPTMTGKQPQISVTDSIAERRHEHPKRRLLPRRRRRIPVRDGLCAAGAGRGRRICHTDQLPLLEVGGVTLPASVQVSTTGNGSHYLLLGRLSEVKSAVIAAEPEHDRPVCNREHVAEVMGHQDDSQAALRRRAMSSRTCAVCSTPRAAVGSSSRATFGWPSSERVMATDCRCPPERDATWVRTLGILTARSRRSATRRRSIPISFSHVTSRARPRRTLLSAEEQVGDDVQILAERQILKDGRNARVRPNRVAAG